MHRLVKIGIGVGLVLAALPAVGFGYLYWRVSNPVVDVQALPPALIDAGSPEGKQLLATSATADHAALITAFQTQEKGSWCGVASSTIVLDALTEGPVPRQADFFDGRAGEIRSFWKVTFGGMNLDTLGRLLEAHGLRAEVHHAGDETVESFRASVAENLKTPGDYVLVNYQREALAQGKTGHISPIGAYEAGSDRFLVMDVATYKWPQAWVSGPDLFAAMNTIDSDGGKTRGWVEVTR